MRLPCRRHVDATSGQPPLELLQMRGRRNDDHRSIGRECIADELGKRRDERAVVLVELDEMPAGSDDVGNGDIRRLWQYVDGGVVEWQN